MSYTVADLAKILQNPDVTLVTDGEYTTIEPVRSVPVAGLSEHDMQVAVIAECFRRAITDSRWSMVFAIPNGGARSKATAGKLKAEGVSAGVPDLFVAVPSRPYHGLWLELKVGSNKPSRAQLEWMRRLRQQGYKCVVVWDDPQRVIETIEAYLEGAS